jgi:L-cysteine desulfidase
MLAGFKAIEMVENKIILPHNEGLTNKDCFLTIKYLGNLSKTVMETTNNEIINIIKSNIEKK